MLPDNLQNLCLPRTISFLLSSAFLQLKLYTNLFLPDRYPARCFIPSRQPAVGLEDLPIDSLVVNIMSSLPCDNMLAFWSLDLNSLMVFAFVTGVLIPGAFNEFGIPGVTYCLRYSSVYESISD